MTREPSILSILGVTANEDVNTRLLRHAIQSEPAFRDEFLKHVLEWDEPGPDAKVIALDQVVVRVQSRGRRLDLVVVIVDRGRTRFAIVENKLLSGEGEDQTRDYAHSDTTVSLKEVLRTRVGGASLDPEPTRVFLVLQPGERAASDAFRVVRHQVVADAIATCDDRISNATVRTLLRAWRFHVEAFERALTSVDLGRPLPSLFLDDAPELDTGYGVFCRIAAAVVDVLNQHVAGEVRHWTYRGAGQGRSWFGVQIWAPHWVAEESHSSLERSVHFQVSWNPLDRALNVSAHYETSPYRPLSEAEDQFPAGIDAYRRERDRVTGLIMEGLGPQGWTKRGSWNSFGKLKDIGSVDGRPAKDVVEQIAAKLASAWTIVESRLAFGSGGFTSTDRIGA